MRKDVLYRKNDKKNIYFLCYSRYVIMIAFMIKKIYHRTDNCILLISDEIGNENGLIKHIRETGLWSKVICVREKNLLCDEIYKSIDIFLENNEIDVFYISHIMRYASHYFVHKLNDKIEINMFDEGIISLDIIGGYEEWNEKIRRKGLVEFEFSRIDKYYVLFPQITKPFHNVTVKGIPIEKCVHERSFLNELNQMFGYTDELFEKKILIIDADIAAQGDVSQEYENECAENILNIFDNGDCSIKIKPSESKDIIRRKYKAENLSFISNGLVPFEIQYMNWLLNNTYPRLIVAFPTTLIWNMMLINKEFGVKDVKFVSIAAIMAKHYRRDTSAKRMLLKIKQYLICVGDESNVMIPETWEELKKMKERISI